MHLLSYVLYTHLTLIKIIYKTIVYTMLLVDTCTAKKTCVQSILFSPWFFESFARSGILCPPGVHYHDVSTRITLNWGWKRRGKFLKVAKPDYIDTYMIIYMFKLGIYLDLSTPVCKYHVSPVSYSKIDRNTLGNGGAS